MRTIVKTGVVLLISGYDPHRDKIPAAELGDVGVGNNYFTIYGDMHVVGQCAVLYVPNKQVPNWPKVHGTISLVGKYFYRKGEPYSTIVLEAQRIYVERDALHELDLEVFVRAGGRVRV